jgi:hypothetical protein
MSTTEAAALSRLRAELDEARANSKRLHDALLTLKSKIGPRSALARFIDTALSDPGRPRRSTR